MVKRVNNIPQCPECGRRRNRVVLTSDALNGKFDIIRRRHCLICDHRWYTGQIREQTCGVEWASDGKLINMSWAL